MNASVEDLSGVEGVGEVIAKDIYDFFRKPENIQMIEELKALGVEPAPPVQNVSDEFKGKTFVLTGTLQNMTRDEASEKLNKWAERPHLRYLRTHLTLLPEKMQVQN